MTNQEVASKLTVGSRWSHYLTDNIYVVDLLANFHSDRPEYPLMVVFRGEANGRVWCRAASDWHRSMTLIAA